MEVFLFIVFVAACALVLYRAVNKSKKGVEQAHKRKLPENRARAQRLETPAVHTPAAPNQPWHPRRHQTTMGSSQSYRRAPGSQSEWLEYDGYSRRDRHHLADTKAHIKDEGHLEDPKVAGGKGWGDRGRAH